MGGKGIGRIGRKAKSELSRTDVHGKDEDVGFLLGKPGIDQYVSKIARIQMVPA